MESYRHTACVCPLSVTCVQEATEYPWRPPCGWAFGLLWLRSLTTAVRPHARCLELRMDILGAAELPSLRALYLQTRPPRERPLPEGYQSVGRFMATPTRDTICLWSLGPLLCTSLTVAVTCASLVTNVVGNLFICGFAIGNHLSSNAC